MSAIPPDNFKKKIADSAINENLDDRSRKPEPGPGTRQQKVDESEFFGSGTDEASKKEAQQALMEWEKVRAAYEDPKRLENFANYRDDIIVKRDGFIGAAVLPGENLKEFEELLTDVCKELQLEGRLERELGLHITHYFWRLNNLDIFDVAQRARAKYGKYFKQSPLTAPLQVYAHMCGDDLRKYHAQKAEQEALAGQLEALRAAKEVEAPVEYFTARQSAESASASDGKKVEPSLAHLLVTQGQYGSFSLETILEAERVEVDSDLAELAELVTPENFNAELEMRQRLGAAISQSMKLLVQFRNIKKTLKPVSTATCRPQLAIKSGKPPKWGTVRLVTTKRRR